MKTSELEYMKSQLLQSEGLERVVLLSRLYTKLNVEYFQLQEFLNDWHANDQKREECLASPHTDSLLNLWIGVYL